MARREVKAKFCDSCIKDTPATTTQKFSLNGVDYEIDLCEKHADALTRDFLGWARLARERERPTMFRSSESVRAYTTGTSPASPPPAAKRTPTPPVDDKPTPTLVAIPETAKNWTLSVHAEQQLEDRGPEHGFDRRDVYLACVQPTHAYEAEGGNWRHVRGPVSLIVDRQRKKVVTVMPNAQEWGSEKTPSVNFSNKELTHAAR